MEITLAVTTYNRPDMTFESIKDVLDDKRIDEILIVDDFSTETNKQRLRELFPDHMIHWNSENRGCYANKNYAVFVASNPWLILWDSDNTITKEYISRIETLVEAGINENTIYQPSFAKPHFDFRKYSGFTVNRENVKHLAREGTFCTMLNAMNYFVHRQTYLDVWEDRTEPWTADSILQAYNWFKAGNQMYVVPDLTYDHLVHDGSHYKENVRKTGNLYQQVITNLMHL